MSQSLAPYKMRHRLLLLLVMMSGSSDRLELARKSELLVTAVRGQQFVIGLSSLVTLPVALDGMLQQSVKTSSSGEPGANVYRGPESLHTQSTQTTPHSMVIYCVPGCILKYPGIRIQSTCYKLTKHAPLSLYSLLHVCDWHTLYFLADRPTSLIVICSTLYI